MMSPTLGKRIFERFGFSFSEQKTKRLRKKLGWLQTGTRYCQLIREQNHAKRLEFCQKCMMDGEQFGDVIFTDECSVLMENHSRITFRRKWAPAKLKGRPKHPFKVHVCAGISFRDPTKLVFTGNMDANFYVNEILKKSLLPFIVEQFPDGHRFQQDNNPKHTSLLTRSFMEEKKINWWKTPPESPDLNPIEMLLHEMKHFIRNVVKPTQKEELLAGIARFWSERLSQAKCSKYIGHLHKVLPIVIEREGRASGH